MARSLPLSGLAAALLLVSIGLTQAAGPTVSNVRSVQRNGAKLVDIDYDLAGDKPAYIVSLRVSNDDGATFTVPVTSLSGAFGAGIAPGANKRVTWNAGVDWNNQYSPNMRFEVTASDMVQPGQMVFIPGGTFQMGDAFGEGTSAENPFHSVYVSAFFLQNTEVTKAQWDEVRAWGGGNGYTDLPPGEGKAANHPVHSITWHSMVKWCNARSEMEGSTPCYTVAGTTYKTGISTPDCDWDADGYRLPTEAEWEKAARGGLSGKRFPWGNTITHSQANYISSSDYDYDVSPTREYHPVYGSGSPPYTSPVATFPANTYLLYDMAGNIAEWCWDWHSWDYFAVSPEIDPRGPAWGHGHSVRGGSAQADGSLCRVASRSESYPPHQSELLLGFRPARSSVP